MAESESSSRGLRSRSSSVTSVPTVQRRYGAKEGYPRADHHPEMKSEASTSSSATAALRIQPGSWSSRGKAHDTHRQPHTADAELEAGPSTPRGGEQSYQRSGRARMFQPVITQKAHRIKRDPEKMLSDSLKASSVRHATRKRAGEEEVSGFFKPKINTGCARSRSEGPVFERLYQGGQRSHSQAKVARFLVDEQTECTGSPKINKASAQLERSADLRLRWNDERRRKLEELRSDEKKKEALGLRTSPAINQRSVQMAERRNGGRRVEERLLDYGFMQRKQRDNMIEYERQKVREEATPHISALAATARHALPAHERLYAMRKDRVREEATGPEARPAVAAPESSHGEEACTFAPSISKRSHLLAGGDLPRHERVEDRLLRQGAEHRQRCDEQAMLVARVESESRSGKQHINSYSQYLNEASHPHSYRDPIGVENAFTLQELMEKHPSQHAFKPYIGANTREIDRQNNGDRLTWEQRVGNLYYKEQEKENRLERLRRAQEEQEMLRCRSWNASEGNSRRDGSDDVSCSAGGADLHERNKAWKQRLENKRRWGRHHQQELEFRECTFQPRVNKHGSYPTRSSSVHTGSLPRSMQRQLETPPSAAQDYQRDDRSPLNPLHHLPHPASHAFPPSPGSPRFPHATPDPFADELQREQHRHELVAQHLREHLADNSSTAPFPTTEFPDPYTHDPNPNRDHTDHGYDHPQPTTPVPRSTPRRALSLESQFSEYDDENPDRLELLEQLRFHQSVIEQEDSWEGTPHESARHYRQT
ncbi:hypothetical protein DIPPA_07529 [Diplonema papillatum]|nr:hypothetical protein DIPPA_07529 [Diplonema papillatum]